MFSDYGLNRNPFAPPAAKYDTAFSQNYKLLSTLDYEIVPVMREYFIDITEILDDCWIGGIDCKPTNKLVMKPIKLSC